MIDASMRRLGLKTQGNGREDRMYNCPTEDNPNRPIHFFLHSFLDIFPGISVKITIYISGPEYPKDLSLPDEAPRLA